MQLHKSQFSSSSLATLITPLFWTHLTLLTSPHHPDPRPDPPKVLKLARKYTSHSTSPALWLLRLDLEGMNSTDVSAVWTEARRVCRGDGVERVWTWGLADAKLEVHEVSVVPALDCTLCSMLTMLVETPP